MRPSTVIKHIQFYIDITAIPLKHIKNQIELLEHATPLHAMHACATPKVLCWLCPIQCSGAVYGRRTPCADADGIEMWLTSFVHCGVHFLPIEGSSTFLRHQLLASIPPTLPPWSLIPSLGSIYPFCLFLGNRLSKLLPNFSTQWNGLKTTELRELVESLNFSRSKANKEI